jgi:F-type H+-transporting ATPase subunit delta
MHNDNHQSPLAVSYARAILELAHEHNQVANVAEELKQIRQLGDNVPQLRDVLADPAIGTTERQAMLKRVFEGKITPLLLDAMLYLAEKMRLDVLPAVADAFDDLLRAEQGFIDVDITVARELEPQQLASVQAGIGRALNKTAVLHQSTDDSIIGGIVLRVQDKLIDGSIRSQLQLVRQRMLAAAPH